MLLMKHILVIFAEPSAVNPKQAPSWKVQRAAINAAVALEVLLSLGILISRKEKLKFHVLEHFEHLHHGWVHRSALKKTNLAN